MFLQCVWSHASRLTMLIPGQAALTMPFEPFGGVVRHNPICLSTNSGVRHGPANKPGLSGLVLAKGSHGWSVAL